MKPEGRLVVALDVDSEEKALGLVERLKGAVNIFKVGSELFSSCGPHIVEEVRRRNAKVFLDLKFHDIPNTVARSSAAAARLGVFIFNVHALGGYDMMKKAAEAAREESRKLKTPPPMVLGVTILTSFDEIGLKKVGINDNMETQVLKLARLAKEAALDGVVASPSEIRPIRESLGKDFLIVTPGVRPSWAAAHDQKRIATPAEAVAAGADYIVVGRPVTEADDPLMAARRIAEEIGR
jgi:orotidine-5'-phosphate decarboxylase